MNRWDTRDPRCGWDFQSEVAARSYVQAFNVFLDAVKDRDDVLEHEMLVVMARSLRLLVEDILPASSGRGVRKNPVEEWARSLFACLMNPPSSQIGNGSDMR